MGNLDPNAATAKWVSGLGSASARITAGVNAVQVAPGVAAAKQVNTWLAKVQASANKWAKNVSAVSLTDWQNAMIKTGIPRIAQGAQDKQGKYLAFAQSFYPYLAQGQAKVKAMPKNNLSDGIARAVAMINHNANYPGKNG